MAHSSPPTNTETDFICAKGAHYHPYNPAIDSESQCNHTTPTRSKRCEAKIRAEMRVYIESEGLTIQTPHVVGVNPVDRPERGWVCTQMVGLGEKKECHRYHKSRIFPATCSGCGRLAENGKVKFTVWTKHRVEE